MPKKKRKYTRHPMTPERIITMVQRVRTRNNKLWMAIIRLAVKAKPRKIKAILRSITKNDQEISKWMSRL